MSTSAEFTKNPFINEENYLNIYSETIITASKLWANNTGKPTLYAPYMAFCQSSGYGKTRLAMQMADYMPLIYINIRDPESSGVPARSKIADMIASLRTVSDFMAFFEALFTESAIQLRTLRASQEADAEAEARAGAESESEEPYWKRFSNLFLEESEETASFWKRVYRQYWGILSSWKLGIDDKKSIPRHELKASALIKEMTHPPCKCPKVEGEETNEDEEEKEENTICSSCGRNAPPCVLVVIDEARGLLLAGTHMKENERFFNCRTALTHIVRCKFMCLLIDTSPKMLNFMPSVISDPLARICSQQCALFPPLFLLPTIGMEGLLPSTFLPQTAPGYLKSKDQMLKLYNEEIVVRLQRHPYEIDFCVEPFLIVKKSRPLFVRHFSITVDRYADRPNAFSWDYILRDIIQFAEQKLQPHQDKKESKETYDTLQTLAVVGCRFDFMPKERSHLEELVASRMATLRDIEEDRSILEVRYVPEPMLAEAAATVMEEATKRNKQIETLIGLRCSGKLGILNETGDVGEFLGAYCMQYMVDECLRDTRLHANVVYYHRPIGVNQFVEKMRTRRKRSDTDMDTNSEDLELLRKTFAQAFIKMTTWRKIDVSIDKTVLLQAYQLGHGIICNKYKKAMDLVIPMFICSRESPSPSEENISGLFCQIKNTKGQWTGTQMTECVNNIRNRVRGEFGITQPYMQVMMQVGSGGMAGISEIGVTRRGTRKREEREEYVLFVPSLAHMGAIAGEEVENLQRLGLSRCKETTLDRHYETFEELREATHIFRAKIDPVDYGYCRNEDRPELEERAAEQVEQWEISDEYRSREEEGKDKEKDSVKDSEGDISKRTRLQRRT